MLNVHVHVHVYTIYIQVFDEDSQMTPPTTASPDKITLCENMPEPKPGTCKYADCLTE